MQPGFVAAEYNEEAVLKQIEKARELKWSILMVEFDPDTFGNTLKKIRTTVKACPILVKSNPDGSKLILDWCKHQKDHITLHVCGVNSCACVRQTCCGLGETQGIEVKLIDSAIDCRPEYSFIPHVCDHTWKEDFKMSTY